MKWVVDYAVRLKDGTYREDTITLDSVTTLYEALKTGSDLIDKKYPVESGANWKIWNIGLVANADYEVV